MQLHIADRVKRAMESGQALVALETTVITHGMDFPDNLETALAMESAVREAGACPATLGIVAGRLTVGLTESDIERFARAPKDSIAKCSRRDLPAILAAGADGSVTVAGTVMLARAAGIDVVATGGIGGVHRGHPFDVSADLTELARSAVTVVCAGAKSILDLPLTLEVLETQGVPVVGYGTDTLPAFYCSDSGLPLPHRVDGIDAAAKLLRAWRTLDGGNGMLLTVPVPAADALDPAEAERVIANAAQAADAAGITGSAVTPFVLQRVVEETDGRALRANKALLINNAKIAAQMAAAAA